MDIDTKELKVVFPKKVLNGIKRKVILLEQLTTNLCSNTIKKNKHLLRLYQIIMEEEGIFLPT